MSTTTAPVTAGLRTPGVLAADGPDLASHLAAHGPMPRAGIGAGALVRLARESEVTGRGGAGFPTARKLIDVLATGGPTVLVANGAEGEPWSAKDAELMARAPHLVLDGLELVATAIGAQEIHLYAPDTHLPAVGRALRRRPGFDVRLTPSPAGYVAGEESAVLRALAGHGALPFDRVHRVTHAGLGGRPTLVHNVETLARLALLHRRGGRDDTRLITLSGDVAEPGVREIPVGTDLAELVADAGADPTRVRAVLVGGFHGAWVPGGQLAGTRFDVASLARFGASPGAGVIHVVGGHRCGLAVAAEITRWLAGQSARQCGPCAFGLPTLARVLTMVADRSGGAGLVEQVQRLSGAVTARGACRHPDGTARLVRSSMITFADDVARHLSGGCEAA